MLKNSLISVLLLNMGLSSVAMENGDIFFSEKEDKAARIIQRRMRQHHFSRNKTKIFENMYAQGLLYRDGKVEGYEKDSFYATARAGAHFFPLAREGNVKAQHNLAMIYYGRSNYDGAYCWFQKAADQKFKPSEGNLKKLIEEMDTTLLYKFSNEVLIHVAYYLDYNSLLSLRVTAKRPASIVEETFRRRALIKTPLACLNTQNRKHSYPHTVSFCLRKHIWEIPNLEIRSLRVKSGAYTKSANFSKIWNYPGEKLLCYLGGPNPNIKEIIKKFYLNEPENVDSLELKLWSFSHAFDLSTFNLNPPSNPNVFTLMGLIMNAQSLELAGRKEVANKYLKQIANDFINCNDSGSASICFQFTVDQREITALCNFEALLKKQEIFERERTRYQKGVNCGDVTSQLNLGILLYQQGMTQQAKHLLEKATSQGSNLACKYLMYLLEQENLTQTERRYQEAADQGIGVAQYCIGSIFENKGNFEQAKKYYLMASEQGHAKAQFNLGNVCFNEGNIEQAKLYWNMADTQGHIIAPKSLALVAKKEREQIKKSLKLSADEGNVIDQSKLGILFEEEGCLEEAEKYYQKAAHQGNNLAQNNLGVLLEKRESLIEAKKYYQMAADQGYVSAQVNLGFIFEKEGKIEGAKKYYQMAADQKNPQAQFNLGIFHSQEGDTKEAKRYYQMAADQGHVSAQVNLGAIFKKEGKIEEAKKYYQMAADQGNAIAQFNLGCLLQQEGKIEQAKKYYQMAADQGFVVAQYNLGVLLEKEGNIKRSKVYYQMAAEQKYASAQLNLGIVLAEEGDLEQAKAYWEKAAAQGNVNAQKNLQILFENKK